MNEDQSLTLTINGQPASLGLALTDQMIRAAIISLFTWRRAHDDDNLPGNQRFGWWGDSYPVEANDKIGSRLWLLTRSKLMADTPARAKEYAEEALQWMLDDGVAARIECSAERYGMDGLALLVLIYRHDSNTPVSLRFSNLWEAMKHV